MPTPQILRPVARRALSAQSDQRLVQLVREGHGPAFEEIVRRYRNPLVAFAAAIVSAGGAEDVVQSSLAKAHDALTVESREINLRPWLFAIVRNCALNEIRGEARVDELDEALAAHSNPSEIAEGREDFNRLVVAMCALPEAQRQALVKRELEGVGHGEIAAQLGTTATAVRGLIFRARTQLRNATGALVPLPVLRALLTQSSAAGAVGGGASVALLGGAGAKGGAAIAAAVLALGTGIAIEKHRGNSGNDGPRVESAHENTGSQASDVAGGVATVAEVGDETDQLAGAKSGSTSEAEGGKGSGPNGSPGTRSSPGGSETGTGSVSSHTDEGASGDQGSSGPSPGSTPPDDGGSEHSGPGSSDEGSGHEGEDLEPPPAEGIEDNDSGPSGGPDPSPDGEPPEPADGDDHSGPGSGDQSGPDGGG